MSMLATAEFGGSIGEECAISEPRAQAQYAKRLESRTLGPSPKHSWYVLLKTGGEWTIALFLLLITSPLLLVLAALVKRTSSGPAFYAQTRLGQGGRHYRILKLRTMVHDAEVRTGPVWAAKDDLRITPLGRFLRNTHLDELPQLLNVLRGEMALIGPRPERPEIAGRIEQHVPEFRQRLKVRPGVTGLAQMILPADDPDDHQYHGVRRKLAHDLFYVREVSFILDLRIVFCTACFFLGAAIDSIRHATVRSYRLAVAQASATAPADDCEQAA